MAWQNATVDSGGERVVVQALGADYRGVGAPQVVSQNITGQNDLNPAVAALPEGRSVVVWESGPRSSQDIFIRFLDAQGQFQTDIQPVNSFQAGVQSDAAVSALANGTYWWCGPVMDRMVLGREFMGNDSVKRVPRLVLNFG